MDFTKIKKTLLIGAGGKTGFWYSRLLLKDGIEVYAFDQNPQVVFDAELLANSRFHVVSAEDFNSLKILENVDSLTLSPGVDLKQPVFLEAMKQRKTLFSELEYCYEQLKDRKWVCVTGTDGKSTTVALIEHCLNHFDIKAVACGNYGLSFSRILYESDTYSGFQVLVAELSSYQLELCRNLKSDVSIFLNLAPDHLNRYTDLEDYGLAKWNVVLSVKENGLALVNKSLAPEESSFWKDSHPLEKFSSIKNIIYVDSKNLESGNFHLLNDSIVSNKTKEAVIPTARLQIHGNHNYSNVIFTLEVLEYFSCTDRTEAAAALSSFRSLPHRYEKLDTGDGNIYINDSKATTTQAAVIAINNSSAPLFVFLGGRSKGEDYTEIARVLKARNASVFLYGENRFELENVFNKIEYPVSNIQETLEGAVKSAYLYQESSGLKNVTYLLSPASTSWDQYSSFEERGETFKKIVAGLVK